MKHLQNKITGKIILIFENQLQFNCNLIKLNHTSSLGQPISPYISSKSCCPHDRWGWLSDVHPSMANTDLLLYVQYQKGGRVVQWQWNVFRFSGKAGKINCWLILHDISCKIYIELDIPRPRQNGHHITIKTFSNAFSWVKIYEFWLRFFWIYS